MDTSRHEWADSYVVSDEAFFCRRPDRVDSRSVHSTTRELGLYLHSMFHQQVHRDDQHNDHDQAENCPADVLAEEVGTLISRIPLGHVNRFVPVNLTVVAEEVVGTATPTAHLESSVQTHELRAHFSLVERKAAAVSLTVKANKNLPLIAGLLTERSKVRAVTCASFSEGRRPVAAVLTRSQLSAVLVQSDRAFRTLALYSIAEETRVVERGGRKKERAMERTTVVVFVIFSCLVDRVVRDTLGPVGDQRLIFGYGQTVPTAGDFEGAREPQGS